MRSKLNMDDSKFANMHGFTLCSPHIRSQETLLCMGITIYAIYNATNNIRKNPHLGRLNVEETFLMVVEFAKKAVSGHDGAIKCYNSRWIPGRQENELTWSKDPWDEGIRKRKEVANKYTSNKKRGLAPNSDRWDGGLDDLVRYPKKSRPLQDYADAPISIRASNVTQSRASNQNGPRNQSLIRNLTDGSLSDHYLFREAARSNNGESNRSDHVPFTRNTRRRVQARARGSTDSLEVADPMQAEINRCEKCRLDISFCICNTDM